MFKEIRVYDMDGVLVDTSHRYRNKPDGTIDLDYWFANRTPDNIMRDKLLPMAEQYQADLKNPEIYVIICTSRVEYHADIEYINKVLGMPDNLIMRPAGNMEPDGKLKRRALSRIFNLKQFKRLTKTFWDDNIKNLNATNHLFDKVILVESKICERV